MPSSDLLIHSNQIPRLVSRNGLSLREDTLYTNQKGKQKRGIQKRASKALEKLQDPLSRILEPGEVVFYAARAQAPASFFEQWTLGWVIYYITATTLVFTNRRLLHFLVRRNGSWKRSLRSLRWGDLAEAKVKGWLLSPTFKLRYRNGKREAYRGLRRDDAKKIKVLVGALLPASTGEVTAMQEMTSFCPECFAPLASGTYQCGRCLLAFKEEKTMVRRSLLIPGGGYFYAGHRWLGFLDFIVETYLSALLVISLLLALGVMGAPDLQPDDPSPWFAVAVIAAILAVEKWFTVHHCRRFIREFIPVR